MVLLFACGGPKSVETTAPANVNASPADAAPVQRISCKQAVDNGLTYYLEAFDEQSKTWTKDQIDKATEQIKEALPKIEAKLVDQCEQKNWDDATRECLMQAKDWATAQKCGD